VHYCGDINKRVEEVKKRAAAGPASQAGDIKKQDVLRITVDA
jgi:hypothetical protein